MELVHLDHAASTPLAPEVRAAVVAALDQEIGNPSSRHRLGVSARRTIGEARRAVARSLGAQERDVVFTSGGTESNNLAVLGFARAQKRHGRHVLHGPTEHPSVRDAARALADEGFDVEEARLGPDGNLDLADLERRLRPDTVVVAQMLVNNEFGTIYPVARLAGLVRARSPHARLHVDAVQAIGKLELSLAELGAHSLSISAHKIHGPKGVGALALAPRARPRALQFGGAQEDGLRSGTENVAGIAGLGVAARLAAERVGETHEHLAHLRQSLEAGLRGIPGARLLAPGGTVSPAICDVLLPGPPAEAWLHHLETRGVLTSVGSACQAQKGGLSPALLALGLAPEDARRVLRLSFSRLSTAQDVELGLAALVVVERELGAGAR
jgi:cysteine desulfurase